MSLLWTVSEGLENSTALFWDERLRKAVDCNSFEMPIPVSLQQSIMGYSLKEQHLHGIFYVLQECLKMPVTNRLPGPMLHPCHQRRPLSIVPPCQVHQLR